MSVRSAAGAPRRLRQRYALCRVERYAPDRAAVVVVGRVCVIARAVFTYHRAITAVSSLYNLYVIVYGLQCLLLGDVYNIRIMIMGDDTVRCLATILPWPALSGSHSGPWVWVGCA